MKTVATTLSVPGFEGKVYGYNTVGFYGAIPGEDLITYPDLIELVGLEDGVPHNEDRGWLVYEVNAKPLYVSMRTLVHSASFDALAVAGVVYGTRAITIGGHHYKVRLLTSDEWDRFMYPIHVDDPFNWKWDVNYTDDDLGVGSGEGRSSWVQDIDSRYPSCHVHRGNSSVEGLFTYASSSTSASFGWRVVLEAVTDEELEEMVTQPMKEEGDVGELIDRWHTLNANITNIHGDLFKMFYLFATNTGRDIVETLKLRDVETVQGKLDAIEQMVAILDGDTGEGLRSVVEDLEQRLGDLTNKAARYL